MLILVRKVGESIIIGDNVTVKVLGIRSGHIKLGIEAPKELAVHREEIYARIQLERAEDPQCDGAAECGAFRFAQDY